MGELSRRTLLKHSGAAAGVGGLVGVAGLELAAPAQALTTRKISTVEHLHASQLRIIGPSKTQSVGDRSTVRGTVHERADGRAIGELFASRTLLSEPSMFVPELGYLEDHLFVLREGTITGRGTVSHDGSGSFTITGGTGRYANAHGTYASRHCADHSGTGTGQFTFTMGATDGR